MVTLGIYEKTKNRSPPPVPVQQMVPDLTGVLFNMNQENESYRQDLYMSVGVMKD
jgi:hypothetical protein